MKHHNLMIIGFIMAGALAFLALFYRPVIAEEDEILRLRQKVTELEGRIKDMENLLKIYHDAGDIDTGTERGWQNKKNWRRLKTGMTKDQVQSILGEPIKTIKGVRAFWYYPNIYRGYVSFDEKGFLTKWNEP
ncbi:MAG: outer membrane protein assembly factor BamE [Deltaproteobacteria bacterium]|nr:outer membrane protein assembly factor BamE [Deltaproteobacteria bacterium]